MENPTFKLVKINLEIILKSIKNVQLKEDEDFNSLEELKNKSKSYIDIIQSEISQLNFDISIVSKTYSELTREMVDSISELSRTQIEDLRILIESLNKIINSLGILKLLSIISQNEDTIILVGANGSGKSSLVNYLQSSIFNNLWVLPAQKFLYSADDSRNSSIEKEQYLETIKNKLHLEEVRNMKRSAQFINLTNDFNDLINILVNDHAQKSMDDRKNNNYNQTLLEKLEVIWKKIIPNIELIPHASSKMINVNKIGEIYSLNGLSDGEKSIIYYIAKVLLAPKKSYIVVDEPETYLHPSIYNKLWDLLIEERKDCQFIFSSHTMDFITARNDVSIAWCKNFKYPDKFELKIIGVDAKMPTDLKIELLGNRKPVIFCEGALSSLDYQVYSSLFLDEYLVKPVGGHNKVIQYTKSYNSLEEFEDSKAFGIIDRDFHGQRRIEGLSKKNIITTKYNEIEMLLLDKRIVKAVIEEENPNEVDNKIQHFEELFYATVDQHKNKIANQYIKKTLEDRFHNFVFQKYDKINTINNQINSFVEGIDVEVEYQLKLDEVNQIIENKEYDNLLAVCNLKKAIIPDLTTKCLNSNYLNKVIKKIKSSEELRTYIVNKYFNILVD